MNLEVEIDLPALSREIRRYAGAFGETSRQALTRVAVHTAKEAATVTEPKGNSQRIKRAMAQAVINGVDRTTIVINRKPFFNRLKKADKPVIQWGATAKRWRIHKNQITESRQEVWNHIERHRGKHGKPKSLGVLQRKVIPLATYKALTKPNSSGSRVRLMAVAKGAWIGAGLEAQKWVQFDGARPLGKNYMSWARRHTDKGRALRVMVGERYEIHLVNKAYFIKHVFDSVAADRAMSRGWQATIRWYQVAVAKLDRRPAAA